MESLQKSLLGARLFVIAALLFAAWAMVSAVGVTNSDEAGVRMVLPDRVADWTGTPLRFCPDELCGDQYPDTREGDLCPKCGKPLTSMNFAEKRLLPKDTGLVRSAYAGPSLPPVYATIVLSGDDRSSIHRPQVCMTAAGWEIQEEYTISVPLPAPAKPLDIRVLELSRPVKKGGDTVETLAYAYWFVGKGRRTASHLQRMAWMASDRVLHGVSHRWAYVSLALPWQPGSDAHLQTIANFASAFHPEIAIDP